MNELNAALERDLDKLAIIKTELSGIEDLLEEKPVDPSNILSSLEQRETQILDLQQMLPKLKMYDSRQLKNRSQSVSNDQLFQAFCSAMDVHNAELTEFKKLSAQQVTGRRDLNKKAEELKRISLKQYQLDAVVRQIQFIKSFKGDRQLQKAMLGTLFIWYEKGNEKVIPSKPKLELSANMTASILPPMAKSVTNATLRAKASPLGRNFLRENVQQS